MKTLLDLSKQELVELIKRLQEKITRMESQRLYDSWKLNPDRSGGAFTEQEIKDANSWK